MTIMLADKTLRVPRGIIRDIPIHVEPYKYPIDFVLIDMPTMFIVPLSSEETS